MVGAKPRYMSESKVIIGLRELSFLLFWKIIIFGEFVKNISIIYSTQNSTQNRNSGKEILKFEITKWYGSKII